MTANARLKEALTGGSNLKEKSGPPVADGVLTPTPDSQEVLEWRSKSATDCAGTSSTYLDEEDEGVDEEEGSGGAPRRGAGDPLGPRPRLPLAVRAR